MARVAAHSDFWAALYYTLRSHAFAREQRSVLCGQLRYRQEVARPSGSAVMLRRNIHRIEKGLLMRPRRTPFAMDYIAETVACYERAVALSDRPTGVHVEEIQWAHDVLQQYFAAMPPAPPLEPLRAQFLRSPSPGAHEGPPYVPYRRNLDEPPPVRYEDLLQLAVRRRSVRWFLPRPVPREMIDRAMAVAALSPSACNRQPFVFRIFDDPALVAKVVAVPYGMDGYGHNVPVVAVLVGKQRHFFGERDRHLIYIDGALAAMAFLLALEAQGLASCGINWPDLAEKERAMSQLLGLEPDERPVMLIALGFPDPEGLVASSRKKPLDLLRRYNFE